MSDERAVGVGERLCKCGHTESLHTPTFWPTEHIECRAGGIIEPDDVGWQCQCRRFRPAPDSAVPTNQEHENDA
jgi:hypothetical protein